jgi:hypothetical protein
MGEFRVPTDQELPEDASGCRGPDRNQSEFQDDVQHTKMQIPRFWLRQNDDCGDELLHNNAKFALKHECELDWAYVCDCRHVQDVCKPV